MGSGMVRLGARRGVGSVCGGEGIHMLGVHHQALSPIFILFSKFIFIGLFVFSSSRRIFIKIFIDFSEDFMRRQVRSSPRLAKLSPLWKPSDPQHILHSKFITKRVALPPRLWRTARAGMTEVLLHFNSFCSFLVYLYVKVNLDVSHICRRGV